jgi:hypothetical protein
MIDALDREIVAVLIRCASVLHHRTLLPRLLPDRPLDAAASTKLPLSPLKLLERVKGIEPSYSAWKAQDQPENPIKSVQVILDFLRKTL